MEDCTPSSWKIFTHQQVQPDVQRWLRKEWKYMWRSKSLPSCCKKHLQCILEIYAVLILFLLFEYCSSLNFHVLQISNWSRSYPPVSPSDRVQDLPTPGHILLSQLKKIFYSRFEKAPTQHFCSLWDFWTTCSLPKCLEAARQAYDCIKNLLQSCMMNIEEIRSHSEGSHAHWGHACLLLSVLIRAGDWNSTGSCSIVPGFCRMRRKPCVNVHLQALFLERGKLWQRTRQSLCFRQQRSWTLKLTVQSSGLFTLLFVVL